MSRPHGTTHAAGPCRALTVGVTGSFDDLRSRHIRFLAEAAKLGPVHVHLWADETVRSVAGHDPHFPQEERTYLVQAVRYVEHLAVAPARADPDQFPSAPGRPRPAIWAVLPEDDTPRRRAWCEAYGVRYHVVTAGELAGFPDDAPPIRPGAREKVIVTGCYDWFHSGHVRFFEEVSALGDLYVAVGNDTNIALLKGDGIRFSPPKSGDTWSDRYGSSPELW